MSYPAVSPDQSQVACLTVVFICLMLPLIPQITGDSAVAERTRILVTGAASGIGAAIGRALASPDTAIMLHTRRNRDGVESVAADLRLKGAETAVALGDLADAGTADGLVAETVERLTGLDVLISNAGFADRTPISSLSDAAMRASVEAVQGAFF
jgi:3-oxoacyl-[acyl-carrier protein] reductase